MSLQNGCTGGLGQCEIKGVKSEMQQEGQSYVGWIVRRAGRKARQGTIKTLLTWKTSGASDSERRAACSPARVRRTPRLSLPARGARRHSARRAGPGDPGLGPSPARRRAIGHAHCAIPKVLPARDRPPPAPCCSRQSGARSKRESRRLPSCRRGRSSRHGRCR